MYQTQPPKAFFKKAYPLIKAVLKNFAEFTGKHMCRSVFLNKVADLRPETLLKKETLTQVFS